MGRALARGARGGVTATLLLLASACASQAEAPAVAPRQAAAPAAAAAPDAPAAGRAPLAPSTAPRTAAVERVVLGDLGEVQILEGDPAGSGVLLYLHGRCGDPDAFRAFAAQVPPALTLISVRGDVRCKASSRTQWTVHTPALDQRLRRVVSAVSARRVASRGAAPLRDAGWLVFGYSQGALRAEALLARFPARYVAGVLAGGPRAPKPGALASAQGIVLMAGELDVRSHLQRAADTLLEQGKRVRFEVLPGARHGEYGPEGEKVVGAALRWLLAGPHFTDASVSLQN